jgi:hypothetical protein
MSISGGQMSATLDLPFQLGEPTTHRGLTIAPLFPVRDPVCRYVGLDEALSRGLEIGEVDTFGDVNQLLVQNPLDVGVLLYDGEELLGAMQNRILNLSVLVGAGSKSHIPVSCVERGRWSPRTRKFASAGHVTGPQLRRRKATSLGVDALRRNAAQHEVWSAVDEQLVSRLVDSPTHANSDGYAARASEIRDHSQAFAVQPGQCGMVVVMPGQGWCVDAVSRPEVFARMFPKLVAGYAYEAGETGGTSYPPDMVLSLLGKAQVRLGPSAVLGRDVRLEGTGTIGSGLMLDGELVQFSAYGDLA